MSCRLFPLGRESDDRVVWSCDEPLFVRRARSHSRFPERSRARAVGDHFLARRTDPPLLKVQYQRCFLSFISGQAHSSSVALGNAPLLPFLGVSPLFFISFFSPQCTEHPKATSEIFAPACAWHTAAVCVEAAALHPLTQVLALLRELIA